LGLSLTTYSHRDGATVQNEDANRDARTSQSRLTVNIASRVKAANPKPVSNAGFGVWWFIRAVTSYLSLELPLSEHRVGQTEP